MQSSAGRTVGALCKSKVWKSEKRIDRPRWIRKIKRVSFDHSKHNIHLLSSEITIYPQGKTGSGKAIPLEDATTDIYEG